MAKILIVDDEPRIRDLIREHLQYAGFTCEEAGDGTAALSVLSQGGIDLVILDIMMPFMDGMTCLREMRNRHINTPVIILTARGEEYDKLAGLEQDLLNHRRWLVIGAIAALLVRPFMANTVIVRHGAHIGGVALARYIRVEHAIRHAAGAERAARHHLAFIVEQLVARED